MKFFKNLKMLNNLIKKGRISRFERKIYCSTLSHVDSMTGKPQMVDVSTKNVTSRQAQAQVRI
jgi:hypothetical protein